MRLRQVMGDDTCPDETPCRLLACCWKLCSSLQQRALSCCLLCDTTLPACPGARVCVRACVRASVSSSGSGSALLSSSRMASHTHVCRLGDLPTVSGDRRPDGPAAVQHATAGIPGGLLAAATCPLQAAHCVRGRGVRVQLCPRLPRGSHSLCPRGRLVQAVRPSSWLVGLSCCRPCL